MDNIIKNVPTQFGALGLLIIFLAYVWWAERKERLALYQEVKSIVNEMTKSHLELQATLKTILEHLEIERMLEKYVKHDSTT